MPYIKGDHVVVTDEGSQYWGLTGVVDEYFGDFDVPKVIVKLDNHFGDVYFYDTAIALASGIDAEFFDEKSRRLARILRMKLSIPETVAAIKAVYQTEIEDV